MWTILCTAFIAVCTLPTPSGGRNLKTRTLLVSFDGFRWDYFKKTTMHNFNEVARTGVKVESVMSTFNTKSFPTHYSIATGLHQENHGILGNHFFDPVLGHFDRLNKSQVQDPRWWLGEPIWKTVRKSGRKAATFFWPGSETALSDPTVNNKYVKEYNNAIPFKSRVRQVMDWFTKDDVEFATLYYHEPDLAGHIYGPNSPQLVRTLKVVDSYLGYLLKQLKNRGLWDIVNLVIVSDHGMTYMNQKNIINLVNLPGIRESDIKFTADWGTICQIEPAANRLDIVYRKLRNVHPHLKVYKKEDFPPHWHFSKNKRVRPIIVVPDEGYNVRLKNAPQYTLSDIGTHGYDNRLRNMKTMLRARGPAFKQGFVLNKCSIVDIYPMLCDIMGIAPAGHDGNLVKMRALLKPNSADGHDTTCRKRRNVQAGGHDTCFRNSGNSRPVPQSVGAANYVTASGLIVFVCFLVWL